MLNNIALPWFALTVKPRHEKVVAQMLQSKGYEQYLPLYKSRHRHAGRFRDVDLPLLPSYVLCRFDLLHRLPILTTPGVRSVVGLGRVPEPIDEAEVSHLRRIADSGMPSQPWPFLKSGDLVRVEEGPLKGAEGILLSVKDEWRLVVSITLLQRAVAVAVDRRWVRPIGLWAARCA